MLNKTELKRHIQTLSADVDTDKGCEASELNQRVDDAFYYFCGKRIVVVQEWFWIDFESSGTRKNGLSVEAMLFAENIISASPSIQDNWILSSALEQYVHPGLFVTASTCYVLSGKGLRGTVERSIALRWLNITNNF